MESASPRTRLRAVLDSPKTLSEGYLRAIFDLYVLGELEPLDVRRFQYALGRAILDHSDVSSLRDIQARTHLYGLVFSDPRSDRTPERVSRAKEGLRALNASVPARTETSEKYALRALAALVDMSPGFVDFAERAEETYTRKKIVRAGLIAAAMQVFSPAEIREMIETVTRGETSSPSESASAARPRKGNNGNDS